MTFFKRFRFIPAVTLAVLAIISCDDDFTNIGGGLVGGQLENLPKYEAGIVAYNKMMGPVQTNNLPAHLLGVYQEPIYGQQVANVLTQLSLSANNPTFGNQPVLDSVVLSLPYYSTKLPNDEAGNAVYRLDSIYGNSPYKLTVSRSNLFLNEFDPDAGFEARQRYYSNQGPLIENALVGDPIYVNESFLPSASEVTYYGRNAENEQDTLVVAPRLRAQLPMQFFQENILDKAGSPEFSNNNTFRNYLRGLYFQAEPIDGEGNMMLLNFNHQDAGIILYYSVSPEEDAEEEENLQRTFRINFGPSTINTFSQEVPEQIAAEIEASNGAPGAENLFLQGGEGSMAIIELFEDEEELADLRSRDWLINEASLTFHVNRERVPGGQTEPVRLYLYNLEKNELLVDYSFDPSLTAQNPANAVITHSQPLVRDEDGNGLRYKIRITEHVRQIINNDATNVRLGLVVIQNILQVNAAALREPVDGIRRVPIGTVITPQGTILHGNLAPDESKKLKFEIFYTETDN